jgi:chromate transporter
LNENPVGLRMAWLISFAAFVGVGLLRLPLAWVLFGLGILACWLAHRALSVIAAQNPSNADTDKAES